MPKPQNEDFNWQEQAGARPLRLRPKNPRLANLLGYLVSQIVGFGALALVRLVSTRFDWSNMGDLATWTAGTLGYSQFFLVPFGMGFVASDFWQDERESTREKNDGRHDLNGSVVLNTVLSCLGAG